MKSGPSILPALGVLICGALLSHGEGALNGRLRVEAGGAASQPSVGSAGPATPATSPALGVIIGSVPAGIGDRLKAARRLGNSLGCDEITALYAFLKSPSGPRENNPDGLHALKNEILNALREQTVPPAGLTGMLAGIYHDPAQDSVTRDYAIQHLCAWYAQGAGDAPDAKQRIRTLLKEATQEDASIAGTAMLGLHRLSSTDATFNQPEINALAVRLACSERTEPATRIATFQVCGERSLCEALPAAESVAQASACLPLRVSAIAALGYLGGPEQARLLRRLEAGQEEPISNAIRGALRRLERKQPSFPPKNPDYT